MSSYVTSDDISDVMLHPKIWTSPLITIVVLLGLIVIFIIVLAILLAIYMGQTLPVTKDIQNILATLDAIQTNSMITKNEIQSIKSNVQNIDNKLP